MNKKIILSSILALGVLGGVVGLAHGPIVAEAANITGGTILYMKPNSYWTQSSARFAMYLCNGSSAATWVNMTDEDGDGNYQATVPAGQSHKNVIFVRMNPSSTDNNWNSDVKWNQTSDLTWDGTKNLYTIKTGTWDKGGGTWTSFTPTHYVLGTMNNWTISDDCKMVAHTTANEQKLQGVYLESGDQMKIKSGTGKDIGYFGYSKVKTECQNLVKQVVKDDNIEITQTGYYDFYWDYSTNQLWIEFDALKSVEKLLTDHYNNGTYSRNTTINLNEAALEDIATHFHGSVVLERTTYFTREALWMTRGEDSTTYSYYGTDSSGNMTTGSATEVGIAPKKLGTVTKDHKDWDPEGKDEAGMEGFYITLKDIMEKASKVEWTYSNGVYSSTGLTKEFLAFTAPCLLDTQNYVQLTGVQVELANDGLHLRLIASETNVGALSVSGVLSEAIITYEA